MDESATGSVNLSSLRVFAPNARANLSSRFCSSARNRRHAWAAGRRALGQLQPGQIRRRADSADKLVVVSEMLPGPEDGWLELDGERYTSELRIAAVDLTRREHAKVEIG